MALKQPSFGRRFAPYMTRKVVFSSTERIRSHFGAMLIDGITVELMGDLQKRLEDGSWEDPVDLDRHKLFVAFEDMDVPVLSLEYEAQAYRKLGRRDRCTVPSGNVIDEYYAPTGLCMVCSELLIILSSSPLR
jgi:hypothetical protein